MDEDRRLPSWVLPGLGVLAVVALVAVGLLRETPELDPATPEGTVQAYLDAVFAGDLEAAAQYTEGQCDPNLGVPGTPTQGVSASLVSSEVNDQTATVIVQLSQTSNDPFIGVSEWQEWFNLINRDGVWLIQEPVWPFYADC
jgi:hypothetical protein